MFVNASGKSSEDDLKVRGVNSGGSLGCHRIKDKLLLILFDRAGMYKTVMKRLQPAQTKRQKDKKTDKKDIKKKERGHQKMGLSLGSTFSFSS